MRAVQKTLKYSLVLLCGFCAGRSISFEYAHWLVPVFFSVLFLFLIVELEESGTKLVFFWFFGNLFGSLSWMIWALVEPGDEALFASFLLMSALFFFHAAIYGCLYWLIEAFVDRFGRASGGATGRASEVRRRKNFVFLAFRLGLVVAISEFLRTQSEIGISWAFLGYSQVDNVLFRGFFPLAGVYGSSAVMVVLASLFSIVIYQSGQCLRFPMMNSTAVVGMLQPVLVMFVVTVLLWSIQSMRWTEPVGSSLPARVIHTFLLDESKYLAKSQLSSQSALLAFSAETDVAFTLYPELFLVAPAYQYSRDWREAVFQAIRSSGNAQIVGMPDAVVSDSGEILGLSNALVQLEGGGAYSRQRKEKLIPFAEAKLENFFLLWVAEKFTSFPNSNFLSGAERDAAILKVRNVPLSATLCSEISNPVLVQARGTEGHILLNSSSESWIISEILDGLILKALKARVLESQKPMLRSANVGFSGMIDSKGLFQGTQDLSAVFEVQPFVGETPFVSFSKWVQRYSI